MALHHHSHLEAKNKHHLLLGKPTFIDMNNLWIAHIYNPKLYLLHPYTYDILLVVSIHINHHFLVGFPGTHGNHHRPSGGDFGSAPGGAQRPLQLSADPVGGEAFQ